MTKGPEAKLVRDPTMRWAKKHGIKSIRMYFGPGIQNGWLDDLFLIPGGKPLFIEFKAPGKKPTPKQAEKIKLLQDLGYDVAWCCDKEDAIATLKRCVRSASTVPLKFGAE